MPPGTSEPTRNLSTLQYLGRWARADTLRYYLHEALTVRVEAESRPEAKQHLEFALDHVNMLRKPPRLPCRALLGSRTLGCPLYLLHGMEAPRGVAGRRPIIRLSRTTPPRGELAASSTGFRGPHTWARRCPSCGSEAGH